MSSTSRIPASADHVALRPDSQASDRVGRFGFSLVDPSDADSVIGPVRSRGGSLVRRRELAPEVVEVVVADPAGNVISL